MAVKLNVDYEKIGQVYEFPYKDERQIFTAKVSGYYKMEAWGASGASYDSTYHGGLGGYNSGIIFAERNEKYDIYTGEYGKIFVINSSPAYSYNGGGCGSYVGWSPEKIFCGGGATDIRIFSDNTDYKNANSLNLRIMVAGGGGGGGYNANNTNQYAGIGGNAGGLTSYSGIYVSPNVCGSSWSVGYANQTGSFKTSAADIFVGKFGLGANYEADGSGAGFYGGPAMNCNYGASGGSSYISGHTGSVAIAEGSTSEPRAVRYSGCTTGTSDNRCSVHYSDKIFTNTLMIDGAGYKWTNAKGALQQMPNPSGGYYASGVGHSGNGYARITYLGTSI